MTVRRAVEHKECLNFTLSPTMTNALVSSDWLYDNRDKQHLIILDASPTATVGGKTSEYQNKVISQSCYFDLKNNFSDPDGSFPNTMPSQQHFEEECQKLGISNATIIVVYDNLGIYSSPRVWWMFKAMGHDQVYVLDGGLPDWIEKGYPTVEKHKENFETSDFKAVLNKRYLKSYEQVLRNTSDPKFTVIDARSSGRFEGTEKEPRKHLKSGHIPGSKNIPFQEVLNQGKYKPPEALKEIFKKQITDAGPLVFSCGSGLTACIILLASEIAFNNDWAVYDGSWTEWAERQGLKETE